MAHATSEQEIQKLARALYQKAARQKPPLFDAQDLLGRMIDWSLDDESLRVALFRFVDVLPSLESSSEIGRHLEEYFSRVDHALSGLAILAQALHAGTLVAPIVRRNVIKLARRFIAEESGDHLTSVLSSLRKEPAAFTIDVVGEATVSDGEAAAMQQRYLELMHRLVAASAKWSDCAQIDQSPNGKIPRVNLSVKLSSLCARFDPLPAKPVPQLIALSAPRREFRNQAPIDFSFEENQQRFAAALGEVRGEMRKQRERDEEIWLKSVNPANANEIIRWVRKTTIAEADKAIDKAARFFPEWRDTPARKRAEMLFRAAELMREQRWELAAREFIEVGKGWREADADVCEAIDYLDYYGHEMLRLSEPRET